MAIDSSVLRAMKDAGATVDVIIAAVEADAAIEAARLDERRRKDAERQRKSRASRKSRDVTVTPRDACDQKKAPQTPKENTPFPPLKGGTSPIQHPPSEKPIAEWVEEIWEITPKPARVRTSKADVERALRSALRRDHDPEEIRDSLAAYYASPDATKDDGKYAKGAHRLIENDRWQSFGPPQKAQVHTLDPWPARVREYARNGYWNVTDWGPKPGKPGCRAEVLPAALETGKATQGQLA